MVETQRPERLPLDPTLEAHIPADRSSIAYRRGLKRRWALAISFWYEWRSYARHISRWWSMACGAGARKIWPPFVW